MSDFLNQNYWPDEYFNIDYWQGNLGEQTLSATLLGSTAVTATLTQVLVETPVEPPVGDNRFWVSINPDTLYQRPKPYKDLYAYLNSGPSTVTAKARTLSFARVVLPKTKTKEVLKLSVRDNKLIRNNNFWLLAA